MISKIAAFELKYHLRSPLFYILFIVFFLLTFGAVTSDGVQIGGAIGNVNRNAPIVIMQFLLVMSVFGVLTTTAFVANSVHRDFEMNTDSLFFTTPITKLQYLGGRFLGSFTIAVMVYFGVASAIMVGGLMPWIEKERLGAFTLVPYLFSFAAFVIPNLLLAGAIFFAVAALTRSLMATYAAVIGFFVAYGIADSLTGDLANDNISGMLDPFGFAAFAKATRYWTVFDKNARGTIPMDGLLLWNRLLWVGLALLILAFAVYRFQFATGTRKARKQKAKGEAQVEDETPGRTALVLPKVTQLFGTRFAWKQFFGSVKIETAAVLKSIPFIIIVVLGMANIWGASTNLGPIFGTKVYPLTHMMVEVIDGAFAIFALIIATFFAGDMVWRERTLKLNDVYDSMPHPTWVTWAAKLASLVIVLYTALTVAILTAIAIQASRGYFNFELPLYFKGVFLYTGVFLLLIAGIAFFMQIAFNQKFVGFLGVLVWFVVMRVLPALDLEHRLYRVAGRYQLTYSDMNGYGHFAWPAFVFALYWLLFIAALIVVGHLLWVRGTESAFRTRLKIARQRFGKGVLAMLLLFVAGFVATGCYIFQNTNRLNTYRTTKDNELQAATAEKKYKKYESLPQPRITDVKADVDIFPERRAVDIRGSYVLANKTGAPLSELHVLCSTDIECTVTIPNGKAKMRDEDLGYAIYTLDPPMQPGATMTVPFHTSFDAKGFPNAAPNNNIVENGTFFNNFTYFPHIGYFEGIELQDRGKRRKYGLGPIERMKKPDDLKARMNNQISRESDWLNLDTTVSTSGDQIALAPGYLQREWTQHGRRYFHYKTTSPILGFWAYLSARYSVKRDQWKGIPIEIYYDKKHSYNVDRMIDATKKSLDYFTANFSPYQHKQVRILEFPLYARFAQSFPNTIPFSESIGFVADLRDKEKLDYVFYVTAHEVAHQWWAHQVIGGNVQGSTMLVETMAQYSALMVMEKEYGRDQMKKFLEYELDRYLSGRGGELVAEMPLALVENQQYIHYRKGSLVMYALRDAIGEAAVNRALAKFIRDKGFAQPPYPTALELVQYFRAEAPPEHQQTITDLFETITLYDNQAKAVTSTKRPDGKYLVKLTVESKKLRATGGGDEKEIPMNDLVDVGVLKDKKLLFLEKRRITTPKSTFEFVVNEQPTTAGVDPLNKLIDRNPKDNTKKVQ